MKDAGLLAMRLTTGGLLAGHGAQKLFGSFGGYGLEGTGGWLESLGLKPGKTWAAMAGLAQAADPAGRRHTQVRPGLSGGDASPRRARDHSRAYQGRLAHLLDRGGLLPYRDGERGHPDGSAAETTCER